MTHRQHLARIELSPDADLVVSLCDDGKLDLRIWSATGGVKLASGQGFTIPRYVIGDLIDALQDAAGAPARRQSQRGRKAAHAR